MHDRLSSNDTGLHRRASAQLRASLVVVGCCTALGIGFIDTILAVSAETYGYPSLLSVFPTLALLVGVLCASYLALSLLAALLLPDSLRARAVPYALSLGCFLFTLFVLLWVGDLIAISSVRANPEHALFKGALIAGVSVLAGVGTWQLAAARGSSIPGDLATLRLITALVVALGVTTLCLVTWVTELRGASPWVRFLVSGGILLAMIALLFLVSRLKMVASLRSLCLLAVSLVLLSPIVSFLVWRAEAAIPDRQGQAAAPVKRVILITIDTLRKDSLTVFDRAGAGTPQMDSLAEDSLRFTNAFSPSPWTIPSVISIMTGVSADIHGVNEDFACIPGQFKTLAEYMGEAGYRTAAIGSHPQLLRMGRGFDDFDYVPKTPRVHAKTTGGRALWRLLDETRPTHALTDRTIAWMTKHREEEFFLWIHYLDPHSPYSPPEAYLKDIALPDETGSDFGRVRNDSVRAGRSIRTPEDRVRLKLFYDAEVRYVDDNIGRLISHLRELGIYDDALIVLTSDHGEEFWEHGNWEHGHSLYNELVTVPLLIKLPDAAGGRRVDQPVSTDALLPTILDLCSIDPAGHLPISRSVRYLWDEATTGASVEPIFLSGVEYYEPREGIVSRGMKYILGISSGEEELYDLDADPLEQNSLAGTASAELQEARALLENRRKLRVRSQSSLAGEEEGTEIAPHIQDQLRELGYVE